jgi:hypothetical protein
MNLIKEFKEYLKNRKEYYEICKKSAFTKCDLNSENRWDAYVCAHRGIILKFNELFPEPKEPPKDDRYVVAQTKDGKWRHALYDKYQKKWYFIHEVREPDGTELSDLRNEIENQYLVIDWKEMEKKDES